METSRVIHKFIVLKKRVNCRICLKDLEVDELVFQVNQFIFLCNSDCIEKFLVADYHGIWDVRYLFLDQVFEMANSKAVRIGG